MILKLLRFLPKKLISYFVGQLVHFQFPNPIGSLSVKWFAKKYKINLEEAEKDLDDYKTIGDLFTRKLKPGVRSIGDGAIHPCDSLLTENGIIRGKTLIQAKSHFYKTSEFLGKSQWADLFDEGVFLTYYLCPSDYHRVHFPINGEIIAARHISGTLWPVNEYSVKSTSNLFSINERFITLIKSNLEHVAVVMVGALNVGYITASYDSSFMLKAKRKKMIDKIYEPKKPIKRGDELGIFHMGSTVIVLYSKETEVAKNYEGFEHQTVQWGKSLFVK